MVEIKLVKTKKDVKKFVDFENKLYIGCDSYVPSYYKHAIKLFSSKNPNLISNETIGFLAYQEGKIVGRAMCFINRIDRANPIVRIGCIDFINDLNVSEILLLNIESWAKSLGASTIVGNLGFNDLENMGMLEKEDENFVHTIQCKYNYSYYINHLKNYGYKKSRKLRECTLTLKNEFDSKHALELLNKLMGDNGLRFVEGLELKIRYYARKVFDLLYDNSISGYPLVIEDKVFDMYLKRFKSLVEDKNIFIIVNDCDDVVGALFLTNNTSLALQTTNGMVLCQKNMYNVGFDNIKILDIGLLIATKNNEIIWDILLLCLAIHAENYKITKINANLWLNKFLNSNSELQNFNIENIKERYLMTKKIEEKLLVSTPLKGNKKILK